MSDAEEKIEIVEFESTVDEETAELVSLIESFGVADNVINKFLANQYTIETLKFVERKEIEELITQPYFAERTRFIRGLNDWRKGQNLPLLSESTIVAKATFPSDESKVTRENCTATFLLKSSAKGQAVLKKYLEFPFLSRADKKNITQIVVDGFKDRFCKLFPSELEQRATELKKLFPSEPQEVWYQSSWSTNNAGRRIKLRKQAKGKLYDRNINYKPIVFNEAAFPVKSGCDVYSSTTEISDEQVAEYQQVKKWIIHNQDEWEELKNKWKQTSRLRLFELAKNNITISTSTILSEYSVLRNHQAYQLVQIDFQHRYPDKEKLLFDRWDQFVSGLCPILEIEVSDVEGKVLLNRLRNQETTTDGEGLLTVLLLTHILPSPMLTISQKRRWKPSIVESRESVITQIESLSELHTTLTKHLNACRDRGIPSTPFIVVHGTDTTRPEGFAVWNNEG
ncbi:uncharacterized protein LOC129725268 [Wyeomyia smithii]|uniref:uncharacterized protein LOC129725268 n=1 Tax=Wyeomyia smithii TaxID=174621 RepID=UPI002467BA25|nr:uncharacterized protein LOC129725268 [Wyeomyia smithii]XP_055536839.1 uncharacterized protein LOC129725268 [Wyeomyia smithii]